MNGQGKIGGSLGQVRDPATSQEHRVDVFGTFSYSSGGMPPEMISASLLNAARQVIMGKVVRQEISLYTLGQSLPALVPELLAAANLAQHGVQVYDISLQARVEGLQAPGMGGPAQMPPDPTQAAQNAMMQSAKEQLDPRNYDYAAQVKIGGFKLRASTDGGFDSDGLAEQVKSRAKSEIIWWAGGCLVLFIVGIGLLGLGWYIYREVKMASGGASAVAASKSQETETWDGSSPYKCMGAKNVKISGTTAKLSSGTAVSVSGGCNLTLENCDIEAPTALSAMGGGKITVRGGKVKGSMYAAKALANAEIEFQGTEVSGKTQALGSNAKITGP